MNPFADGDALDHLALTRGHVHALRDRDYPWHTLTEADVEALAWRLKLAKDLVGYAKDVQAQIESALARALEGTRGPVEVIGVGTVERHGGKKRTAWDHPRVVSKLADFARAESVWTAEHPADVAARIVADAAGMDTQSAAWRAKSLRRYGVNPDDYSTAEYGQASVQLTVTATEEEAASKEDAA